MARIEKTVFISYRRTDVYTALAVYENLKNQGYDVFFDYRSISSGDFEQIITSNIKARAHFLLILTATALDRCNEPGDWLRREIEIAIDEKRNVIPLFFKGFRFGAPSLTEKLTGKLKNLSRYNGLNVHEDYFEEAMHRLSIQYLNLPLDTVLHPVSTEVQKVVRAEQVAADRALEQIEDVKELVKGAEAKFTAPDRQLDSKLVEKVPVESTLEKDESFTNNFRFLRLIPAGFLVITILVLAAVVIFNNWSKIFSLPTLQPASPTEPGIVSYTTGTDGMILLYVFTGEFTMGEDNGEPEERPAHKVDLDAFWIDQTEVTNSMYAKCVAANQCNPLADAGSSSRSEYFGNPEFDNYPVVYVTWNDANAYCAWVNRRLPTEAEWEKAARGTDKHVYPWGDTFDGSLANFCDTNCRLDWKNDSFDDGFADTSPVGKYPDGASLYGALDMAGNVWEWVADWYSYNYYASSPASNPLGPDLGQSRVIRGGAWDNDSTGVRSTARGFYVPTFANNYVGFRCAMSVLP
jgi:formylglycine-generating enzyme required for sulfatase activity